MSDDAEQLSPEMKRIKEAYERKKKLFGPSERKKWNKQLDATRKAAEKLRVNIGALPMERFYDLDKEGNPDYACLGDLADKLDCLLHQLDMYDSPNASDARGLADDWLVKRLWDICPDAKRYNNPSGGHAGSFVSFLEEMLPKLDISASKVSAFAERARKLSLK